MKYQIVEYKIPFIVKSVVRNHLTCLKIKFQNFSTYPCKIQINKVKCIIYEKSLKTEFKLSVSKFYTQTHAHTNSSTNNTTACQTNL